MPWRCSSLMMRRSVQARWCFGLLAFAVVFGAGWVAVGAEAVVVTTGAVAAAGAGAGAAAGAGGAGIAGGRSTYFGASTTGATSLICVVGTVVVAACGAAVAVDSDRLRSPAWADAEARTMAATRMILRM